MAIDREAIFRALFALSSSVQWPVDPDLPNGDQRVFAKRSRRLQLFSEVPVSDQPYLGQAEHDEQATQVSNLPYKWVLNVQWVVYHRDGDQPNSVPTVTNNLIMSAVERALYPSVSDPGYFDERNTLSGLVYHCFIAGTVFKDPGDIDNQAMIVVPITILVP